MKQTPNKKAYDREYRAKNLKRVPLDLLNGEYDDIKAAATAAGMKVTTYIKAAIRAQMERDGAKKSGDPD